MNLDAMVEFLFVAGMAVFGVAFVWGRARAKRQGRLGRRIGFFPSGAALGNALQVLQVFAQPHVRHQVTQHLEEETEEDDEGGPEDPVAHLLGQAKKIQRGTLKGPIVARVPGGRGGPRQARSSR